MTDFQENIPAAGEELAAYTKRLEAEGQREIYIRKAQRAHFGLSIDETIAACAKLSAARHLELQELRSRFPSLNENRLTWKISQTLTIPKDEARIWAQTIIAQEGEG